MKLKTKIKIKKIKKWSIRTIISLFIISGLILSGILLHDYYYDNRGYFYKKLEFIRNTQHRIIKKVLKIGIIFFLLITVIFGFIALGWLIKDFYDKHKGLIITRLLGINIKRNDYL